MSTDEQAERGVSLEAQRARVTAYCAAQGMELVEVIEDAGLSAKTLERPGLQRALSMLGAGADVLVVAKLDRLTRSIHDWCHIEERFAKGDALRCCDTHLDLATATGLFTARLYFLLGQLEREQTAERTSVAQQHKSDTGGFVGGKPPFGYSVSEDGKALVKVEAEQLVIAAAKAAKARGLSLRAIAAELAAAQMLSRTGTPFAAGQVARMLEP